MLVLLKHNGVKKVFFSWSLVYASGQNGQQIESLSGQMVILTFHYFES